MGAYESKHFAASVLILALAACGGGGDDNDGSSSSGIPGPWISIEVPTTDPTASHICNGVLVGGSAGFGTSFPSSCCTGTAEKIMGVSVTWTNETTGSSGDALQVAFCPLFGLCDHHWSAPIPLVLGDNRITVTATDTTTGAARTDSIIINKPILTYTISGTFLSHLGAPPGIGDVFVTRVGADGSHVGGVGSNGTFRWSCLPEGSYTLTPSSTVAYVFSPADLSVTVAGADVPGQSFTATAFVISGSVTFASNGAGRPSQGIHLSGSGSIATHFTDSAGAYSFLVPNGSYTLTPVDSSGVPEASSPPSRNVTINDADVPAQDFAF